MSSLYIATMDTSRVGEESPDDHEQTLLLVLKLSNAQMGGVAERAQIMALAQGLDLDVQATGVGELEGHEIGGGSCILSFCGQDVDRLMEQLRTVLRRSPLGVGGHFVRRIKGDTGRWEQGVSPI